ncbi:DUF4369 domain-containing protein [Pedobacter sp. ASV28]|uniref:DUF4369 domain-containing protein n=1 Tax=Pedobacter sp. ASV28 TaxID=2795123 RepID=UPI0018EC3D9C|nr:DUF4369 domain-containing protein [Pedobacter sp. ASV28]
MDSLVFKGAIKYPVIARMFLHKNPYVVKLAKGEKMDYLIFYLEPVKMKMEAVDSLKNISIKGSSANIAYADLKAMLKNNNEKSASLKKEYDVLPEEKQKDSLVLVSFIVREEQLAKESYQVHLAFAKKYINSYYWFNKFSPCCRTARNGERSWEIVCCSARKLKKQFHWQRYSPVFSGY